jgi:hypothetical protein
VPLFGVPGAVREVAAEMVAELVEWRLAEYRRRGQVSEPTGASAFDCRVIQTRGKPILKLVGSEPHPIAYTLVQARIPGGEQWIFDFQKIACNVARPAGGRIDNQLAALVRRLFGKQAGQPGTDFRLRFEHDAGGWRAVVVGREDAQVLPLVPRVKVRAFASLRVAAGWLAAGAHADDGLEELEEVELPGPIPDGCVAVRVSGDSMAGWRSEIRDGDWLVLRPAAGVGFGAVEGEVVVLARGDAEARTFHVKRVVRGEGGQWWLRSDNPEVGAVEVGEGDQLVGLVLRAFQDEGGAGAQAANEGSTALKIQAHDGPGA